MHAAGGPSQNHERRTASVLRVSLGVTLVYILVLVVTGLKARSLALLSEAGHNVSDFLALALSLAAVYLQQRPPSTTKTFGYHRAGVVAAFINSLALVGIAFYIFYEAVHRMYQPVAVRPGLMIGVAAAGVVMNGALAVLLWRASGSDVNVRSVFLHELGDTLSTAAVIGGGWAIMVTGHNWIDPVLSFGIGVLILWSSFGIIRETLNILLEGVPAGMEQERILKTILAVQGVRDVHDLHIWSIGSSSHALSCHVSIDDIPPSESEQILHNVLGRLRQDFDIHHSTIQFEHADANCDGCIILPAEHHSHNH